MSIASEISRLQTDKECIRQSIIGKGVSVAATVSLDDYSACIDCIQQGGGGVKAVSYIAVGGGGSGGTHTNYCGAGGGGGGAVCVGQYVMGCNHASLGITIGAGGIAPATTGNGGDGGTTCISGGLSPTLVALGGCGGKTGTAAACLCGGDSGVGYAGGAGACCSSCTGRWRGGGGAGAAGAGGNATTSVGGAGGLGKCGYGGGGGGTAYGVNGGAGCCGGGNGQRNYSGCTPGDATTYGSGGGGGLTQQGGAGCQGVVLLCYKTDGTYGITDAYGGCKYTSGDYTVHCFTSTGLFIVGGCTIGPGIYYNPTSCLISMSCDGTNWLTIQDRNLGATSNDITATTSYGCMYQWGNNYGFAPTGTVSRTTTKVNTTGYGPGNYYSRNCFVYDSTSCNLDWSSPSNDNLWGATTGTNVARQGPAPSGYRVPSGADISCMVKVMRCIKGGNLTLDEVQKYLCIPLAGYRGYNNGCVSDQGSSFGLWMSSYTTGLGYCAGGIYTSSNVNSSTYGNRRGTGYPIRAFKNTAEVPTMSGRTVLL